MGLKNYEELNQEMINLIGKSLSKRIEKIFGEREKGIS